MVASVLPIQKILKLTSSRFLKTCLSWSSDKTTRTRRDLEVPMDHHKEAQKRLSKPTLRALSSQVPSKVRIRSYKRQQSSPESAQSYGNHWGNPFENRSKWSSNSSTIPDKRSSKTTGLNRFWCSKSEFRCTTKIRTCWILNKQTKSKQELTMLNLNFERRDLLKNIAKCVNEPSRQASQVAPRTTWCRLDKAWRKSCKKRIR